MLHGHLLCRTQMLILGTLTREFGSTPGKVGPCRGDSGWTSIVGIVIDGQRRVKQVTDWFGGTGPKPAVGQYIGPLGFVDTIAEATDIRGPAGSDGGGGGGGTNDLTSILIGSGDFRIVSADGWPSAANRATIVIPEGADAPEFVMFNTGRITTTLTDQLNGKWHFIRLPQLLELPGCS